MCDQWDRTLQTGTDTEYTFVALGLCVGATYAISRQAFKFRLAKSGAVFDSNLPGPEPLRLEASNSFFVTPIPLSPCALALRI